MKLTVLLPVVMTLAVLPNISAAQSREAHQHRNETHGPVVVHKRVVYKTGAVVRKAPTNSIALRFGGVSFMFNNGLYYRHMNNGYKVVRPPVGLKVRHLPNGYERIVIQSRPYYFAQGIYYVFDNGDYRVIDEPSTQVIYRDSSPVVVSQSIETQNGNASQRFGYVLGNTYDELPSGVQLVSVNKQQYFQYRDIYFIPQSSAGEVRYLAVKLN
ncbi:MAG: DUF6515 family protein [Paraglaciecola polaris]|uniref:DUF6515 family protein n=1 Tax=Paraglaciecola polaris TaxID=222814 RepID=UPI00300320AA|tara:strand:+ start:19967 stop:20605 length:639 start_codon:yes stop_codon:yes gene_type:complete